jgi:hypothetical protein
MSPTTDTKDPARQDALLTGTFDTHIHAGPDVVPRSVDFLTVARDAVANRMTGVVFKDIGQPTIDRAYAVRVAFPDLLAFGGIVLDRPAGGLNPAAVERALRLGGRFIWMPVSDARHTVSLYAQGKLRLVLPPALTLDTAISLADQTGKLRDDILSILTLIAEHDAVLGTGHISPEEALLLVTHARAAGVRRIVVNHPSGTSIGATLAQQRELARLGAYLEHCYAQTTSGLDGLPLSTIAEAIRAVGAQSCILATDLGQIFNPTPAQGLRLFLQALLDLGIPHQDIALMTRDNPRTLIL